MCLDFSDVNIGLTPFTKDQFLHEDHDSENIHVNLVLDLFAYWVGCFIETNAK